MLYEVITIIDHFVRLGFHLPVQEDVFQYLTQGCQPGKELGEEPEPQV